MCKNLVVRNLVIRHLYLPRASRIDPQVGYSLRFPVTVASFPRISSQGIRRHDEKHSCRYWVWYHHCYSNLSWDMVIGCLGEGGR